jgi:hypothetical protein
MALLVLPLRMIHSYRYPTGGFPVEPLCFCFVAWGLAVSWLSFRLCGAPLWYVISDVAHDQTSWLPPRFEQSAELATLTSEAFIDPPFTTHWDFLLAIGFPRHAPTSVPLHSLYANIIGQKNIISAFSSWAVAASVSVLFTVSGYDNLKFTHVSTTSEVSWGTVYFPLPFQTV